MGRIAEKEGWLMNSTCWPLFFVIGLWRLLYCPKLWRDALWLLNVVHYTSNCLRHFIIFLHLQRSMASSLFILCAWQSSRTPVYFTCLTVLSDNLCPGSLWYSSWSWTLSFILHKFLHPIINIFSQHMPIPTQPVLLQYQCYIIYTCLLYTSPSPRD